MHCIARQVSGDLYLAQTKEMTQTCVAGATKINLKI